MKKVLNGKVYDTDSARKMAFWSNGLGYNDFKHCEETLYLKKTGEFFLYGAGGPMSRYTVSKGDNTWSGGEMIIPLSLEAAQKWAEEHLDGDEYEEIFGVVEDMGENAVRLGISVPESIAQKIKAEAEEKGMSVSALIASKFK